MTAPLNILQLHSMYRHFGGEDQSCIEEAQALRERGHRVRVLALRADEVRAPELMLESLGLSMHPLTLLKTVLDGEKLDAEEGFNRESFYKMGELGLLGIIVPEEDGGTGLDAVAATIASRIPRAVFGR